MNLIKGIVVAVIVGAGLSVYWGTINQIIEHLGAIYYWQAVEAGFLVCAVTYGIRLRKGYDLSEQSVYLIPLVMLMGVIGIPNLLLVMGDIVKASKAEHLGTAMSMSAFVIIAACGFAGNREEHGK
mgnify:FL=1|tara:strand:+ start:17615 stop:17992 length:378 start_codon:yes stop_codon:yes gene_type:complete